MGAQGASQPKTAVSGPGSAQFQPEALAKVAMGWCCHLAASYHIPVAFRLTKHHKGCLSFRHPSWASMKGKGISMPIAFTISISMPIFNPFNNLFRAFTLSRAGLVRESKNKLHYT
jgi:hypothetical protein